MTSDASSGSPDSVLEGLELVDWATLRHCRGSAGDLPEVLRALLGSGEATQRRKARDALWDAVQYQGCIFEPTALVVPYLVRGLQILGEPDRGALVAMLGHLASAGTLIEGQGVLQSLPRAHPERQQAEAQLLRERGWLLALHRALWAGRETLLGLLDAPDRMLRLNVPHALVGLYGPARAGVPAWANQPRQVAELSARLHQLATADSDATTQAGLVFAIGVLRDECPENEGRLREALTSFGRPARVAAALALLGQGPEELTAETLIAALADRAQHPSWFPHPFPWLTGPLRFLLTGHLCSPGYGGASFTRALPVLAGLVGSEASQWTFEHDVLPPLVRALGGRPIAPGMRRQDLPPAVLTVLDAFYDNPKAWESPCSNVDAALRPFGLSNDRAAWGLLLDR